MPTEAPKSPEQVADMLLDLERYDRERPVRSRHERRQATVEKARVGHEIHGQSTPLDDEDFRWMVGRSVIDLRFADPYSWWFLLAGGGVLSMHGGTWRVSTPTAMVTCSDDHGHRFGLPAPVDAAAATRAAMAGATIVDARVRDGAPDLVLRFENGVTLELLVLSSGYECWQTRDPSGRCLVVSGSRHASTWTESTGPRDD